MFKLIIVSIFMSFFATITFAQSIPKLTIYTEEFKPYNFEKGGKLQGIAVELMTKLLEKTGSTQGLSDIKLVPWARGYDSVLNNKNTVLFSTTKTPQRDKLFKWACPIEVIRTELIALKSKGLKIGSPSDIGKYQIGTVLNDVGEQLINKIGVPKKSIQLTNSYETNVKKLLAGRIDALPSSLESVKLLANKLGKSGDEFESVYLLDESNLCFAFSKDISAGVVGKFQKALDELRANNFHKELDKKYK